MSAYIAKKLFKISKKYKWITRTNVFFKMENGPTQKGHICEVELSLPGPKIFATSNENNFEMAVKETLNNVEVQLKKRKAKFTKQNISS
jgi:putative sigma-54 modulation protein